MNELSVLKEAFSTGTVPSGANTKKFQKLLKKYEHIVNPKFVHLYTVRDCRYDDTTYRVFAMPVNSESIDIETLEAIREEVNTLPVGSIRYNSKSSGCRDVEFEDGTGKYIQDENDADDVMTISNHFDGVLVFTMAVSNGSVAELDCDYAVLGKWDGTGFFKWKDYTILPIENVALGKGCGKEGFSNIPDTAVEGDPQAPENAMEKASRKYMQIMQYVFYVLVAIGLVWYFFFR